MTTYNPAEIEKKWSKRWEEKNLYAAKDFDSRPKSYILIEFPYPSGERLHVGHARSYSCLDAVARKRRMQGYNVLFPIGWDAFGLPAENYAIKTGIHPSVTTAANIANSKTQATSWGMSIDWDREITTSDPNYYKWTQWIFVQLFKHGLAYKDEIPVNWCPSCKINLANEEVIDGKCERCGTQTQRHRQNQWLLRITKYADRLLQDLDTVDYREDIKQQQINWIGRKEGASIKFRITGDSYATEAEAFTMRLDTIFGVTFLVVAPEVAREWTDQGWLAPQQVAGYIQQSLNKSEEDRKREEKQKTGENTGLKAVNPANGQEVPVWVADYVLKDVGTGVVMGVPAHDQRDFDFARQHKLSVKVVVEPVTGVEREAEEMRESIVAIVHDKKNNKFLSINWGKNLGGNLFIGGGLKKGEDPVAATLREIEEETGFTQVELISQSEIIHHHYVAKSKGVNRYIKAKGFYFELRGMQKSQPKLEVDEENKFKVAWIDQSEVEFLVKDELHKCVFDRLIKEQVFEGDRGILVNSEKYNGMTPAASRQQMLKDGLARKAVTYHLRDWVFSRQHYWGEPIPMVYCQKCGWQPVAEKQLPVELPQVEKYQPTETGESPLATMKTWVNTNCPKCGQSARRETDTMPNWAGSSWYFLRYCDPDSDNQLADPKKLKYWLPVDWYNGGMEHTTLHLLYSRFWHKFLYDIKAVPTPEPYAKRTSHGTVLGSDGRKMSKSRGNVINPDDVVNKYGADTLRLYEMFMGPFDQVVAWSWESVEGVFKFLKRAWVLVNSVEEQNSSAAAKAKAAKLIKKITGDLEATKFNTAVSTLMEFINWWQENSDQVGEDVAADFVKVVAPLAPFMAEEMWFKLGHKASVHLQSWPEYDESLLKGDKTTIIVQVNGKLRDRLEVAADKADSESYIQQLALASAKVKNHLKSSQYRQIWVPGKLINFVI